MATAMMSSGQAVETMPTANPLMMLVAGPVSEAFEMVGRTVEQLGNAPIHHENLAELADHNVR